MGLFSFLASIVHRPPLSGPTSPGGTVIVRISGTALLAFGSAFWLALNATENRATSGLVAALLFHDATAVAPLLLACFSADLFGIALYGQPMHSIRY